MSGSPIGNGILTINEVADYLKVTPRAIYRPAAAKKIPAFKVGGIAISGIGHRRLN
jgi:excisionase family DNA binding protein